MPILVSGPMATSVIFPGFLLNWSRRKSTADECNNCGPVKFSAQRVWSMGSGLPGFPATTGILGLPASESIFAASRARAAVSPLTVVTPSSRNPGLRRIKASANASSISVPMSVLSKKTKPGQSHDTPQYQGGKETTIAANGRERKERNEISWHRRLPHLQIGIIAGDPQRQKHHHNRLLKLFVAPSAKRAGKNLIDNFPLACIFFVFDHAQRTGTSSP